MTKLVNQVPVAVNLEAKVEALLLATRGGLDPARALEAIGAGAGFMAVEQSGSENNR